MNGVRLLVSLALVGVPALVLPAVRSTRHPRKWAGILAISLGSGFVLFEASLIHATLPLALAAIGLRQLAEACRTMGGHLFGGAPWFEATAGLTAAVVGIRAVRAVARTVRTNTVLRRGLSGGAATVIADHQAVVMPLKKPWAVALPGARPHVLLSVSLVDALEPPELDAVVCHELAHLTHHHARFLLLATAVHEGLWFLPWRRRSAVAFRLALERWADESASASGSEARARVRSAVRKLASLVPSVLAHDRIAALGPRARAHRPEWGWATAASATAPLAIGLAATLILHLIHLLAMGGTG